MSEIGQGCKRAQLSDLGMLMAWCRKDGQLPTPAEEPVCAPEPVADAQVCFAPKNQGPRTSNPCAASLCYPSSCLLAGVDSMLPLSNSTCWRRSRLPSAHHNLSYGRYALYVAQYVVQTSCQISCARLLYYRQPQSAALGIGRKHAFEIKPALPHVTRHNEWTSCRFTMKLSPSVCACNMSGGCQQA